MHWRLSGPESAQAARRRRVPSSAPRGAVLAGFRLVFSSGGLNKRAGRIEGSARASARWGSAWPLGGGARRRQPRSHDPSALAAAGYDRTFALGRSRPAPPARPRRRRPRQEAGLTIDADGWVARWSGRATRPRRDREGVERRPRMCSGLSSPSGRPPSSTPGETSASFWDHAWRRGRDPRRTADARARGWGARHLRPRPPALAARRRGAAPPDRPGDGTPGARALTYVSVTVVAASAAEAEVLAKLLFLAGEDAAAALADDLDAPAVLACVDGRTRLSSLWRPHVKSDPTFWILARASGTDRIPAADDLGACRPRRQVPSPFVLRAGGEAGRRHRPAPLSRPPRPRRGGHPRGCARARRDRQDPRVRQVSSRAGPLLAYRPFWTRGSRRPRRRADGDRRRTRRSPCAGASAYATGAVSTGSPMPSSVPPRSHGLLAGTDSGRPWAFGLYLGAVGAVGAATTWRVLVPPLPARPRGAPR